MSDILTDPPQRGEEYGLTRGLHSPNPQAERCQKCGHPRDNHPYRHPFVGFAPSPSPVTAQVEAANTANLRSEIDAIHAALDEAGVPQRESGDGARMLAQDRIRLLATRAREAEEKWTVMVPNVLVALGGTDPNCVVPADVTPAEMAMHAGDVRRALEEQRDALKLELSARLEPEDEAALRTERDALRAAVEEAKRVVALKGVPGFRYIGFEDALDRVDGILTAALSPAQGGAEAKARCMICGHEKGAHYAGRCDVAQCACVAAKRTPAAAEGGES